MNKEEGTKEAKNESQPSAGKKGSSASGLSNRWRDRLLAAFLWLAVIYVNTSLSTTFPPPAPFDQFFEPHFRLWRWLAYFAIAIAVIFHLRLRAFWFLIYFSFFPIVLPFVFMWSVFSAIGRGAGWDVFLLVPLSIVSAMSRVTGPSRRVFALSALPVCYLLMLVSSHKLVLVFVIGLLLVATVKIIWGTFRWVLKPLESLTWLIERLLFYYNKNVEDTTFNADLSKMEESAKAKKAQQTIESARTVIKSVEWTKSRLVTQRSLLTMFLCVLILALTLATVNFGFVHYGLYKIDRGYFTGVGESNRLGDFLYFSAMVMTTSDLSPIMPASGLTRTVVLGQLACSLALLSLLILAFSLVSESSIEGARGNLSPHFRYESRLLDLC
ncbi:MAG TPA: hypothetical protein VM182_02695 [Terriglobia bacterium]|nr:hypothetical protein [Terriglobia bacterium]